MAQDTVTNLAEVTAEVNALDDKIDSEVERLDGEIGEINGNLANIQFRTVVDDEETGAYHAEYREVGTTEWLPFKNESPDRIELTGGVLVSSRFRFDITDLLAEYPNANDATRYSMLLGSGNIYNYKGGSGNTASNDNSQIYIDGNYVYSTNVYFRTQISGGDPYSQFTAHSVQMWFYP